MYCQITVIHVIVCMCSELSDTDVKRGRREMLLTGMMSANPGWQRVLLLHRPPTLLEVFLAAVGWQRNQFTAGVWVSNLQHQLCYKYSYYSTGNCAACASAHEWVMWAGEKVRGFTFVFKPKHLSQSLSTKFIVRYQCDTQNKDFYFKEPPH